MFQVYNSTKHYLYTASCTHHPTQSLWSPFISPFPSGYHHTVVCVYVFIHLHLYLSIHTYIFFAQSLHLVFTQLPYPPSFWELSVCSLYRCLFLFYLLSCSLDFTHNWDHMVFVFLQLAYFTQHNILQVNSCCHKGSDFLLFSWEKKSV